MAKLIKGPLDEGSTTAYQPAAYSSRRMQSHPSHAMPPISYLRACATHLAAPIAARASRCPSACTPRACPPCRGPQASWRGTSPPLGRRRRTPATRNRKLVAAAANRSNRHASQLATRLQLLFLLRVVFSFEVQQRRLDLLRLLGREIEGASECNHRVVRLPQLLIHLAQYEVDGALLWGRLDQQQELGECCVILLRRHEDLCFMEASEGILCVDPDRVGQHLQSLQALLVGVQRHAKVAEKGRRARVDGQRISQVVLGRVVLLLTVVDVAEAVPGVVVPLVDPDRCSVAGARLLEIVLRGVLVAGERVGIRKVGLQLDGALKELQCGVVLLLQ
mmetsp:Transcript_42536/g.90855  ORF Transcript_42536/g.90855 Transcript_42536/m.90855 type:complete len:334 (-) Transcript_42536:580-1581(-)